MQEKPTSCSVCPLSATAGFVTPIGPARPPLTIITDAPDFAGIKSGIPIAGDAGANLNRLLGMLGLSRNEVRLGSVLSCCPPRQGMWVRGGSPSTLAADAASHCRGNLEAALKGAGSVVVAAGDVAAHALTGLPWLPKATMTELHGHVLREPAGRFYVVPTFDFSVLSRGAANLFGIVHTDLKKALQIASKGWVEDEPVLVEDPDIEWFSAWADSYCANAEAFPEQSWLAVDIETPHGVAGNDLATWTIDRINFSCHPDEGITVPWTGQYLEIIRRVLSTPGVKVFWNWRFDVRRLQHAGFSPAGIILDAKDAWHAYQSDMGGGDDEKQIGSKSGANTVKGNSLGFVASLASKAGPWKHLSSEAPAAYAAKDAVQTLRIALWVRDRLLADRMWEVARVHLAAFDQFVIGPAEEIGLGVDLAALPAFAEALKEKERALEAEIEALAPAGVGGLYPPAGWVTPPPVAVPAPSAEPAEPDAGKGAVENRISRSSWTAGSREAALGELGFATRNEGTDTEILTGTVVSTTEETTIKVCTTCAATDVTAKHVCKEAYTKRSGAPGMRKSKTLVPALVEQKITRPLYHLRLPFNPRSPDQMKKAVVAMNLELGKGDKADKLALQRLLSQCLKHVAELKTAAKQAEWQAKADFFSRNLAHREISKIEGTYATGTLKRLAAQAARGVTDGRLHATFSNAPSTLRTSCKAPNLQNAAADRGGESHPAAGFKRVITAAPGCSLIEADFSANEALLTGYFAGDPIYYRLARLGVHAYLTSYLVNRPADLNWSDSDLTAYFDEIKKTEDEMYNMAKRCVHGSNYGLTPPGMAEKFPHIFPTRAAAERVQAMYFTLAPKLKAWHASVQEFAARNHYVGGPGNHPFSYRHWFWDVHRWVRVWDDKLDYMRQLALAGKVVLRQRGNTWYEIKRGNDGNRVIAFLPQSTAAAIIRLCALRLFTPPAWRKYVFGQPDAFMSNYIGDIYYGRTPLRAIIHDSFLLEVPDAHVAMVIARVLQEMRRPVAEMPLPWDTSQHLTLDAAVKVGKCWAPASESNPTGMKKWKGAAQASDVAGDMPVALDDSDEEEDEEDTE